MADFQEYTSVHSSDSDVARTHLIVVFTFLGSYFHPTTRIPNSSSCTSQKTSHPDISETESGIIQGVFLTGTPFKKSKYKKVDLGKVRCI